MPFHKHDCEHCRYLGSERLGKQPADIYYCPVEEPIPTVLIRFDADPANYYSMDVKSIQTILSNPVSSSNKLLVKYFKTLTVEEARIY